MKVLYFLVPAILAGPFLRAQSQPTDSLNGAAAIHFHDGRIAPMLERYTAWKRANQTLSGFRVQLYNGNKVEAQKVRAQFVRTYPDVPVYLTYETPEYRVQAGDFRNRFDAEKYMRNWLSAFSGAFVVPAPIHWPRLPEAVSGR